MSIFRNYFFHIVLLLAACSCFAQNVTAKRHEKTKLLAWKYLSKEKIPGMSVTVSLNDSIIYSEGFGFSDIENKKPVDPAQTRFRMASITKTMTAVTVARLVELGKIDFNASAYQYLDSLPKKTYDFTVAELGGHLSGLQRIAGTEQYTCDNTYNRSDFYKVFAADKLLFEPSTKIQYSNYGYKVLGLIVEKVSGNSIIDNHKQYVIDAVGLKNTYPETKRADDLLSKFYIENDKKLVEAPCLDCTFKYAQGCYVSTSEDLARLGNGYLFPNRLLKKETLVEIIKSKKLKNGQKTNYGFGFTGYKDAYDNFCYGHDGGYEGSRSCLRIYPGSKIVVAILTNRTVENIDALAAEIADNYITGLK